jgi:hypothetical protein
MNTYKKIAILFVLGFHFSGSLVHAGKLYSWVDENGQSQYSDRPPTGIHYTERHIRSGSGKNIPVDQYGLRHGEQKLLRNINSRKSDILSSRRIDLKKHAASKKRCSQLEARYHTLLSEPGEDDRNKIKRAYRNMKSACR